MFHSQYVPTGFLAISVDGWFPIWVKSLIPKVEPKYRRLQNISKLSVIPIKQRYHPL